ncbi:galactitol-1-phosphate 5-dehydrogenase [Paenibacillus eucommiae]|uniref:Threonine dehydrogenase-like Zn-dependent dehydrogenase n=1 Tax=Paenibacillus eucommiae TaxID=1355755 RepID=A0ABS4IME7_9BACL|nr:galactitol-1-phosphate 5-dehydrogenase [Paenibacillus eucommiae]MBP1988752.1 threonine dehydrogenase-like Zn-dependent dehydrogenase [Paenibacillus eucommiae]
MKTLVWNAAETMNIEEREVPVLPENEILIRVEAVGICGSEIEGYLGHNSLRIPPLVMGHEFCGRIEQVGAKVPNREGIQVGQKVVVNPLLYCGECNSCLKGLTNLCASRSIIGIHRSGAFAEFVAVPASAVVPVPEEIDSFRASLAEPLACSLRATRRALSQHPFANVVIFGAGGIGLLCAMMAKILGASRVMIIDTNAERLQIALQVGLDEAANPKEENVEDKVKASFGSKGVDVVIDAAGFQQTREVSLKILNPGGTLMNIGLGIDGTNLPINHLIRSEIEILGSFTYTRQDFKYAVDLLVSGQVTELGWTEVRPLSEGPNSFAELVAGKVTNGKIFLSV